MISLRQHIFSLVAVFVALSIGIAAGSTVVRGPLLENTRSRLETAEEQIAIERAENDVLAGEVAQLDGFTEDGPEQLLTDRLAGSSVLLVVAGDVDSDAVRGVIRSLTAAATEYLGQIRLDPVVFDPEQTGRVAEALGIDLATESDETMAAFGRVVAERIAQIGTLLDGDAPESGAIRGVFGELEDAGLVDLLDVSGTSTGSAEFDVVVLTDRNVPHDPGEVLSVLVAPPDGAPFDTVMMAVEVGRIAQGNESPIDSFVETIRDDGRLRDEVSTVDNAETVLGWVAMVLGLEAAQRGEIGHYGFRDGSERSIPPSPS